MKRLISITASMILMCGLLTGCGGNTIPQATTAPVGADVQHTKDEVDRSKFIGEEKAKEIALKKAGITADGVSFDRIELEKDNGVWEYEIEFQKDSTEYDIEIKADDGTILSWNIDND